MQKDPSLLLWKGANTIVLSLPVRLHNIVCMAMMRLAWKGFLLWIHANHGTEVHHLEEAPKRISTFHNEVSQASFTVLMYDATCTRMRLRFQEYLVAIGNDKPLTAFWTSYLHMTDMRVACFVQQELAAPFRINPQHDHMMVRL